MIAQSFYIGDITPAQYDARLSEGWFRDCMMMYRSDLVVMQGELFQVVHIRVPLDGFRFRKSQRKIMRRVEQRFRVEVKTPEITEDHTRLYAGHMHHFRGFVHSRIEDILYRPEYDRIHLREIAVFDGSRLVATSYFDSGTSGMASLLGLYDREYASWSLGYYTMLREIQWGMENAVQWYYPGYLFDLPSEFDYKLRLGPVETMVEPGLWTSGFWRPGHSRAGFDIRQATQVLASFLTERKLPHTKRFYPYFAAIRMMNLEDRLFSLPVFFELMDGDVRYAACYDPLHQRFLLHQVEEAMEFESLISMPLSKEYTTNPVYETKLIKVTSTVPLFPGMLPCDQLS